MARRTVAVYNDACEGASEERLLARLQRYYKVRVEKERLSVDSRRAS